MVCSAGPLSGLVLELTQAGPFLAGPKITGVAEHRSVV